uniref:AMP-dependent synthetase/ligase domain-containing protein n=1 Tax=Megaselia scalaris TaxID=36166 RepID=T1GMY8_MEGSC
MGMTSLLQSILNNSRRIISQRPFDEEYLLDLVEDYQVTRVYTTVTEFTRLANAISLPSRNLKSLRIVSVGGSYVCSELIMRLQKYLPNGVIVINYTITEFEGIAVQNPDAKINPKSVGKPMHNTFVKVIDSLGQDLGSEKTGEICLKRTDKVFGGYFNNILETEKVIDGWLITGDIGFYDNDGYLYILGRKDEIYTYEGCVFYPTQIEERIYRLKDVREACVLGLKESDENYVPAAVIVTSEKSTLTELDVMMEVMKDMDDCNRLRGGVFFVDEIPKTRNGSYCRKTVSNFIVKSD